MEKLQQQIHRAQRRLNLQRFLGLLPVCWFATLLVAALAIGIHKWFPTVWDPWTWNLSWLVGALVVGLLAAVVWTRVTRTQSLDAAIEIDRRFGLKERVSSSLALSDDQRVTKVGRALLEDAQHSVGRLDVTERFGVSASRGMLLPLFPALFAFLLAFAVSERGINQQVAANAQAAQQKKQVKKSSDSLRKKVAAQRKQLSEKGLKDAEAVLKELDQGLRDLNKKTDGDRKKAMIKLNNLADKLQDRKKQLGGADQLRRQLNKLKDLKQGPADKLAKALKRGKFQDALKEIEKLQQQLKDGKLDEAGQKQLADQLQQMKQKLQEVAQAHKQAAEDLQQQIDKARQKGDQAAASKLQDALDKLRQQMPQMDKLSRMAEKLGNAAQAMKEGQTGQAQQALEQLAADLDQLQNEMDEMEALDSTLDEIRMAKNAMKCGQCGGGGCGQCQGPGLGDQPGQGDQGGKGQGGDGLGAGEGGHGTRPENKTKSSFYDSRVKGKVGPGRSVLGGLADGPNAKGPVRDAIQADFSSQDSGPADPLSGQRLPKSHQRHVEEYFESIREGD